MSAPPSAKDRNSELMRLMGSKTGSYDPEPPDQWRYVLEHGEPEERFLAWVKSKTTHMSRSPFCVSDQGKPLYLEHAAVDLGWKIQTARNVASRLEKQGRIRLEKGKRIWNRADVPTVSPATDDATNNLVQGYWSPYVVEAIKRLKPADREKWESDEAEFFAWRNELLAEGMATMRSMVERVEDSMVRDLGVEKKRLPKRRAAETRHVQLSLLSVPGFVQSYDTNPLAEFVQTPETSLHEAKNGSHKPENGGPSLLSSDTDTDIKAAAAKTTDADQLATALQIDAAAAEALLRDTRNTDPEVTPPEIVELWRVEFERLLPRIRSGRIDSPTGILLRTVPTLARGAPLMAARRAIAARAKERADFAEAEATNRREWQRAYENPDTAEEDRALLRMLLGIEKSKGAS